MRPDIAVEAPGGSAIRRGEKEGSDSQAPECPRSSPPRALGGALHRASTSVRRDGCRAVEHARSREPGTRVLQRLPGSSSSRLRAPTADRLSRQTRTAEVATAPGGRGELILASAPGNVKHSPGERERNLPGALYFANTSPSSIAFGRGLASRPRLTRSAILSAPVMQRPVLQQPAALTRRYVAHSGRLLRPPGRRVLCKDAVTWLEEQPSLPSVVTSLPDITELAGSAASGRGDDAAYGEWFSATVRLVVSKLRRGSVALFYQTDTLAHSSYVDKSYLCTAGAVGAWPPARATAPGRALSLPPGPLPQPAAARSSSTRSPSATP